MSTFDDYVAQRKAERDESLVERELTELVAGTSAIERGMSSVFNWCLLIGGLVAAPFTLGVSLLLSIVAGVAMSGGATHMVKAALPMSVDIVSPKWGCVRVVAGLAVLVLVVVALFVVGELIAFNLGVVG